MFESTFENKIINFNYKQGLKWRGSFKIWIQTLTGCTGCKVKRILVKPKIFKSVYEYLSNESEKSKFAGIKSYGQMNFHKGHYIEYRALKNRHFANDLCFRRNHFCWIRDVKLLLGFKIHNFLKQYVIVAKENVF